MELEDQVKNDNMHRRKSTPIARVTSLKYILADFHQLDQERQIQQFIPFCLKIGSINKMLARKHLQR